MTRLWQCSPVAMRTCGDFAADAGVAEDVVGAGGLFHPPGLEFGELAGAVDGFEDAPLLVGVDHELVGPADLFADDVAAAEIFGGVAAYFEFEVGPAFGEGFAGRGGGSFLRCSRTSLRRWCRRGSLAAGEGRGVLVFRCCGLR